MSDYSIWVVEYGAVERYPMTNLLYLQPFAGFRTMPYCFGVLRSAEQTVLVDVGFQDSAVEERLAVKYGAATWRSPIDVLSRIGVAVDAIDLVVLTHTHFDHAGAIDDFPDARVVVQAAEVVGQREALGVPERFRFLRQFADPAIIASITARAAVGGATLVAGEDEVAPGVSVLPAMATHTAGSQFIVVDNAADGRWLFAGDNVYLYENIEGIDGDGVMVPIGTATGTPETWLHSVDAALEQVGRETRRVLPFHDANLWGRFPSRTFDDGLHVAEVSLAGGHTSVLE